MIYPYIIPIDYILKEKDMIRHIVMFRLKSTDRTADENALLAKEKAQKLPDTITQIRRFEAVVNAPSADKTNYNFALIADFDTQADLDAYQVHPDHKAFGAFISTIKEEGGRACIDYEF